MNTRRLGLVLSLCGLAGCSSAQNAAKSFGVGGGPGTGIGQATAPGSGGASGVASGVAMAGSPSFVVGDAGTTRPLSAHIEAGHIAVSFVTLACSGGCADVVAVA